VICILKWTIQIIKKLWLKLKSLENSWSIMIKEQVLIIKVKYDDEQNNTPHTWNWTDLVGNDHEIEVMNHGSSQPSNN